MVKFSVDQIKDSDARWAAYAQLGSVIVAVALSMFLFFVSRLSELIKDKHDKNLSRIIPPTSY